MIAAWQKAHQADVAKLVEQLRRLAFTKEQLLAGVAPVCKSSGPSLFFHEADGLVAPWLADRTRDQVAAGVEIRLRAPAQGVSTGDAKHRPELNQLRHVTPERLTGCSNVLLEMKVRGSDVLARHVDVGTRVGINDHGPFFPHVEFERPALSSIERSVLRRGRGSRCRPSAAAIAPAMLLCDPARSL